MTRQIFAAEITFQDAPFAVRDDFGPTEKNVKRLLTALRPRVEEVFVLATRRRLTVYAVHDSLTPLTAFFHSENSLKGYVQFYYNTGESVTHLMATVSGLISPIKGEGQIVNDLLKCYQWATDCNCLGVTLDNTLSRAIETGKAVRCATGIDKFCASLVETGLDLLYNQVENVHKKNFLIVGTGSMAKLALDYLSAEGIRHIAVTGDDHAQAVELAKRYDIRAFPFERMADYFLDADVIIGVSSREVDLDFSADLKRRLEQSGGRFILDLGMPSNFAEQWIEASAEGFYNLDDLRRIQPSPLEAFGGLEEAWRMVMRASNDFVHLLQMLYHSPVLTAYLNRQFLKNAEWKVKPRRTLRTMLFKKQDTATSISSYSGYGHDKVHVNNYLPEDGYDVVKNVGNIKKFTFRLTEN
jgi:glutamyl-tRNA reductase